MKTMLENGHLILCPEGRIDSNNALNVETEMFYALEANPGVKVSIDAGKLAYISSAGLRVLMKLLGRAGEKLPIFNVSPEVYDIFEITGFTELFDVKKRLREISVEGCELIGSGAYGKVYRIDKETIAKIYSPNISLEFVEQERAVSRKVFLMRVPTAIAYDVVKCGDCYGVVYELLDARTVAQLIDQDPDRIPGIGKSCAELLRRLSSEDVHEIILATNPNVEGETTAAYIARLVKPLGISVSRLASGMPVGGELDFVDEVTLSRAIEARRLL